MKKGRRTQSEDANQFSHHRTESDIVDCYEYQYRSTGTTQPIDIAIANA